MAPSRGRARRGVISPDVPGLWEDYVEWLQARHIDAPRIVVWGDYGSRRLGSDAALHVLLQRIRSHLPSARVTVVCAGPGSIRARYPEDGRLQVCAPASPTAVRVLARCQILIIGGGLVRLPRLSPARLRAALFGTATSPHLAVSAVKIAGARVCYHAVALDQLPQGLAREALRRAFHQADVVSVRDGVSAQRLEALNIERGIVRVHDPALELEPAPDADVDEILSYWAPGVAGGPRVALCFAASSSPRKVEAIVACTRQLVHEHGAFVVLLPVDQDEGDPQHDDVPLARQVRAELGQPNRVAVIEGAYHPAVVRALLGAMDAAVVERRSALLLAASARIPLRLVTDDLHTIDEARAIGAGDRQTGLEAFCDDPAGEWLGTLLAPSTA